MRIKSPLTNKNEVKPLCEAGADEFFCGIEPVSWRRRYNDFCINQRSTRANFIRLSDLEKAISIAHNYKAKVHIALNAFFYLEEQYRMAQQIIKDVSAIGADGIILADAVILKLNRDLLRGKDVVMGCDATIFNSAGVKFYKKQGATRIVFPRSMTIGEMEDVVRKDNSIEYEVFIIHDLCFFEDGFCTYCKEQAGNIEKEGRGKRGRFYFFSASRIPMRGYGGGCRTLFRQQRISMENNKRIGKNKRFTFWMRKHIQGCGACAIYDFERIGIASLKILDRNMPMEEKVKATLFIKKCADLLNENNIPKNEYIDKCRDLFKQTFKVKCNQYDCYYPSIFLKN
jgi:collagenase-like PrtC family protease